MNDVPVQTTEGNVRDERISGSGVSSPSRKEREFQRALSNVFRATRRPAARLRSLQAIHPSASPGFVQAMRHHIAVYATHQAGVREVQRWLYTAYYWLFLLIYLLSPLIILAAWLRLTFSISQWFDVYVVYAISFGILIILAYPIRWITRRNLEELFFPWRWIPAASKRRILRDPDWVSTQNQLVARDYAAIFWVLLIAGFSGYVFLRTLAEREALITSSVGAALLPVLFFWTFWMAGGILMLIAGSITLYLLRRRLNSQHPLTVISIRLLEVLSLLEQHPAALADPGFKQAVVHKLEDAALRMEYDLARQRRSGDPTTDAWLEQSFTAIAHCLREQKKHILLPEAGAHRELIDFLARELPQVAVGNLGSLEKVEEVTVTERRMGALKRLGGLAAAAVKGSLPLLALWLLQQSPLAVQSDLIDYAFILAAIYLLFSVLAEIDPLYRDKIGAVQELLNLSPRK